MRNSNFKFQVTFDTLEKIVILHQSERAAFPGLSKTIEDKPFPIEDAWFDKAVVPRLIFLDVDFAVSMTCAHYEIFCR
jgi:hypothetical protein